MTKMREIIFACRSNDCRQIGMRVSLEIIKQVLKMVTVIGQFTADSRVEPKFNAHLPISTDDRSAFGTHLYRLAPTGSYADSNFESAVGVWYTPTDDCQSVGVH